MAPQRPKGGVTTRSQSRLQQIKNPTVIAGKRKAEGSPLINERVKRVALGNLANSVNIEDKTKLLTTNTNTNGDSKMSLRRIAKGKGYDHMIARKYPPNLHPLKPRALTSKNNATKTKTTNSTASSLASKYVLFNFNPVVPGSFAPVGNDSETKVPPTSK